MTYPVAPSVVVYVNDPSCRQDGTGAADRGADRRPHGWAARVPEARRDLRDAHMRHAVPLARGGQPEAPAARFDPDRALRDFPSLWRAYCRGHYRDYRHLMAVFGVSERCARKWMDGESGCNGAHLSVAFRQHPDQVGRLMQIAAE